MPFAPDTIVRHATHGRGKVLMDRDATVVVEFASGIQSCLPAELTLVVAGGAPLPVGNAGTVLVRTLGAAIRSTNDAWGVFSPSRIDLLPHQLWVARKAHAKRPIRLLVADDVGLGKTIEAGLVLMPLLANKEIRRLLVICPSGLVRQWELRMREMFDIRLMPYSNDADQPEADYWGHPSLQVVASAQTLRLDSKDRWDRLLSASPWDMVIVDEAHHAYVREENRAMTLLFQLLRQMKEQGRIDNLLLFTGTPHRGKDLGFLSLLALLDERVNPREPLKDQLELVSELVIRNNKSLVTDMSGTKMFPPTKVLSRPYAYSPEETQFYQLLTDYISDGRAYAAESPAGIRQATMLVLIAMQKLAASSVAAVRNAIGKRLKAVAHTQAELERRQRELDELIEENDATAGDERAKLEEELASSAGPLFEGERVHLEALFAAANAVTEETKIRTIVDELVAPRENESVLFFTEYKATQSLLLSALMKRYGPESIAFINGDGFLPDVRFPDGTRRRVDSPREGAAAKFNSGEVRFLISTEAAGEGIDLQHNCHRLVHVDIPWNPMRMHQRVGRLSRYGQKHEVEVTIIYNPGTVEGRIWQKLDEKLARITEAFSVNENPEDMRNLVLGLQSPQMFEKLYGDAIENKERLDDWFNSETSEFGGKSAVDFVRSVFGNVAKFDFGAAKRDLPQLDLPALVPFLKLTLALANRRTEEAEGKLGFLSPEGWRKSDFRIRDRYEFTFDRKVKKERNGPSLAGVGHPFVDKALEVATTTDAMVTTVPGLREPLVVAGVRDEVTTGKPRDPVLIGLREAGAEWQLLRDWELILALNELASKPLALTRATPPQTGGEVRPLVDRAIAAALPRLGELNLGFRRAALDCLSVLLPEPPTAERPPA